MRQHLSMKNIVEWTQFCAAFCTLVILVQKMPKKGVFHLRTDGTLENPVYLVDILRLKAKRDWNRLDAGKELSRLLTLLFSLPFPSPSISPHNLGISGMPADDSEHESDVCLCVCMFDIGWTCTLCWTWRFTLKSSCVTYLSPHTAISSRHCKPWNYLGSLSISVTDLFLAAVFKDMAGVSRY